MSFMRMSVAAVALLIAGSAQAQQQIDFATLEVRTSPIRENVHLMDINGNNLLVLANEEGVLLVDDYLAPMAKKIEAAVAEISRKPIKYVINTHIHGDHLGGNEAMRDAGAIIIAHENVRTRMANGQYIAVFNQVIPPAAPRALPTITYTDQMTVHFGDETLRLIHAPPSHTDSDSMVYLVKANVLHMGGVYGNELNYPFIDMSSGGSLNGIVAAEEMILSVIDDETMIYADRGNAERKNKIQASHDMLVVVRERVQALIDQGKTEDEAAAAKPTADFDAVWAREGSFLTGEIMTRQAYRSLKGILPPTEPPPAADAN